MAARTTAHAHRTREEFLSWLAARGDIAHRDEVLRAGFRIELVRGTVAAGQVVALRRRWLALPTAARDLQTAASAGGRVSCVTLARRRGWWMPEGIDSGIHLHLLPGSAATGLPPEWNGVTHWTRPLGAAPRSLVASVEDALLHIATCLERDSALILWEEAARRERIAPETLRTIRWTSCAARELAEAVTGLADSGLETLVVIPLRRWGLNVRQQIVLAGRPVDLLIEDRLVVQIDGYAFHSSSSQRSKDIAHDAELRLRGYTVLRFSYAQVVHDWPRVERLIRQAVIAGLHHA